MEISPIRAILGFLKPYPWALPTAVMLGLAANFAEGLGIGLLIPLFDMLLHRPSSLSTSTASVLRPIQVYLRSHSEFHDLLLIGVGIVVLIATKAILTFFSATLSARVNGRVDDDIRRSLFRQVLTMDYGFLMRSNEGRLINAFETQTWRAMEAMVVLFDLLGDVCMIVVFVFLLFLISWQLTIVVAILGLIASLLVGRPMVRRVQRLGDAAVSVSAALLQHVVSSLNGIRVVRAFGQEVFEQTKFDSISNEAREIFVRMNRTTRIIPAMLEVAYVPIFLTTVVIAQSLAIGVPSLLAFLLLFYRLQPQVRAMDQHRALFASFGGAVLELAALLDSKDKPVVKMGALHFGGLRDSIVFQNVGFGYQAGLDSRRALSGVSFEFCARKTTAVVGASGAGKTTLINLLCRFYEPTEGQILIDGTPLVDLNVVEWRARLALAGQDAALMDGSILENIAYGCRNASLESVVEASRQTAVADFIESLPRGYQTSVGDRGLRLSEGQRQRIGLARALLRQPEILILDEATNALDGLTEQVVQQALDQLAHKTTVIVIAHRLSTIRKADKVIVMDEGRVVEQGLPEELLARGGFFSRLHAAQIQMDV